MGLEFFAVSRGFAHRCYVKAVVNRAFYIHNLTEDMIVNQCVADGAKVGTTPFTFYGFNSNPGGAVSPERRIFNASIAKHCQFQGFEFSERGRLSLMNGCIAENISGAGGIGFAVQFANAFAGSRIVINGCIANGCQRGFYVFDSDYVTLSGCYAEGSTFDGFRMTDSGQVVVTGCLAYLNTESGFRVVASGGGANSRLVVVGCMAISNTINGFITDANTDRTCLVGNIFTDNTAANLTILGTNNVNASNISA